MKGEGASASALGAKTARACDSCLRRRARWFCGADDAFLCHACDALVHSANQLASRHERVRLQTASAKVTTTASWHSGFTRKARTPRHNKQLQRLKEQVIFNNTSSVLPLVPELGGEEQDLQLVDDELCRVPVFHVNDFDHAHKGAYLEEDVCDLESFSEFDVDLAEFAANVESLLGVNEDAAGQVLFDYNKQEDVTGQVLIDCKEEDEEAKSATVKVVKDEVDQFDDLESVFDLTNDEVVFHWNMYEEEDENLHQEKQKKQCGMMVSSTINSDVVGVASKKETKRERFLRLNYEDVINAWASQGGSPSPWTTGNPPPNFSFDDDTCQNYCLVCTSGLFYKQKFVYETHVFCLKLNQIHQISLTKFLKY